MREWEVGKELQIWDNGFRFRISGVSNATGLKKG